MKNIYVFHGEGATYSTAIFTELQVAETWIRNHHVTGILTKYPLNISIYDWAISNQFLPQKKIIK